MTRGRFIFHLAVACVITSLVTIDATWFYMEKKVYPARLAAEKFKTMEPERTVCRVYVNAEGMMDISSPDGTVEIYSTDNNLVIGDDDEEEE